MLHERTATTLYSVEEGGPPVHITISEPSPEGKSNAFLPLSLQEETAGVDASVASISVDRNRQQQQQPAANVSITITDASPDSAYGPRPLHAAPAMTAAAAAAAATPAAAGTTTAHTKRLAFRRASEAKIVQHKALVHRTSEGPHYS